MLCWCLVHTLRGSKNPSQRLPRGGVGLSSPERFHPRPCRRHALMSNCEACTCEIDSLEVRNSDSKQLNQEEILAMSKVEKSRR